MLCTVQVNCLLNGHQSIYLLKIQALANFKVDTNTFLIQYLSIALFIGTEDNGIKLLKMYVFLSSPVT